MRRRGDARLDDAAASSLPVFPGGRLPRRRCLFLPSPFPTGTSIDLIAGSPVAEASSSSSNRLASSVERWRRVVSVLAEKADQEIIDAERPSDLWSR